MGQESHHTGTAFQESKSEQHRAFVEHLTSQEWLRQWLMEVLAEPNEEHSIESNTEGWENIVACFNARNRTHEGKAYHLVDQDSVGQWSIALDRENSKLVVRFVPSELHSRISPANLATLCGRILLYKEYPFKKKPAHI